MFDFRFVCVFFFTFGAAKSSTPRKPHKCAIFFSKNYYETNNQTHSIAIKYKTNLVKSVVDRSAGDTPSIDAVQFQRQSRRIARSIRYVFADIYSFEKSKKKNAKSIRMNVECEIPISCDSSRQMRQKLTDNNGVIG